MKNVKVLIILIVVSLTIDAKSQWSNFNPPEAPIFRAPVGTKLTFTTQLTVPASTHIILKSYFSGLTAAPSDFYGSAFITVTVTSDPFFCWAPTDGIVAYDDLGHLWGLFCVCQGIFYDTNVIGYPVAYSYPYVTTDTLNFGSVSVDNTAVLQFYVEVPGDSYPVYRRLNALNTEPPFLILDSTPLSYPCSESGLEIPTKVTFHPTAIGHFKDTVYLLDPLRNDSIPLILIGEGVAADVSDNSIAADLHVFRIHATAR